MPVVQRLAFTNETDLVLEFLQQAWAEAAQRVTSLGAVPQGESAVALMRLVVQTQSPEEQRSIHEGFSKLPEEDRSLR